MKVKAKHWLNVDGDWHPAGDIFDVESVAGFEESVEVVSEPESEVKPETPENTETPVKEEEPAEPVKSVRRRKTKKA